MGDTKILDGNLNKLKLIKSEDFNDWIDTEPNHRFSIDKKLDIMPIDLVPPNTYHLSYSITRFDNNKSITIDTLKVFECRLPYWIVKTLPTFIKWIPYNWLWKVIINTDKNTDLLDNNMVDVL